MASPLSQLRQQLSPRAVIGLCMLFGIGVVFIGQNSLEQSATREARIQLLANEVAQLNSLTSEPEIAERKQTAQELLALNQKRLLNQSTEGLNSAELQAGLQKSLDECQVDSPIVRVQAEPSEFGNLVRYTAEVTASDVNANFPACLMLMSQLPFSTNVDYIRWINSGGLNLSVSAYAEAKSDD